MIERPQWVRAFFALLATSLLTLAAPQAVFAAEEDEDVGVEEVVVTGSRVKRSDFSSASPITVITGQSIVESGFANLGEALRSQAVAGTAGFNQSSILSGGGSTSVDLRNLGPSRVLILVNGKRVASFADSLSNQATDLTFVPTSMIERVDILRDGASAAYGADAISGVVNIILKENFEGIEIGAMVGESSEGDGQRYEFDFAIGTTSDRGSIVLGMEYRYQDGVRQRDRDDWMFPSISSLGSSGANNGSSYTPGGVFLGAGGYYCTQPKVFGGDEITNVWPNCPAAFLTNQNVSGSGAVELLNYDYGLNQDAFGESEVYTAAGYGVYEIVEGVEGFIEFEYAKRQSEFDLDGNPGSAPVPATNPNNPFGQGTFYFRPASTVGRRENMHESDTIRIVTGLRGDIFSDGFFNEWSWELSYLYTRVDADLRTDSTWNLTRFTRISDPALCASDPLCVAAVNPSGALDTFRPGNWTQSEIAYFRQNAIARSEFQTTSWFGMATGPVVELPAGDLQLAVGFETRKDYGYTKPDSVTEAGESIANQVFTTEGDFSLTEYFAEIDVPILADLPGAESLDLNLQFRSSDYDTFGEETVWRVGVNWQIFDWVRLRATMSTAYRAPQVTDLYSGGVASFDFISNPCAGAERVVGNNVDLNCLADGIPFGAIQLASQNQVLSGGNPDLEPETADTSSIGLVFTPGGILDGLSVSVDVWDIEVEDLITRTTSDSIVDECYNRTPGTSNVSCNRFTPVYDPIGNTVSLANFTNRLINDSKVSTDGFDFGVHYEFDGFADTLWNLDLTGTYVDENTFYPGVGGADDRGSIPRIKANFVGTVDWESFDFTWRSRYIHGMDDPDFSSSTNVFGYSSVPSHTEHDIRVGWNYDNYRIVFGVNDLFDEDPEYVFGSGNNTDLFLYDSMGRYMFLRATMSM